MESKIRYLEMIQNVITRMASNSFLLKGWTVTLVVGLLAFANIDEMNTKYIILALVPVFFFWLLDGFFIHQEWLFRKLYEHAVTLKETEINFSMSTKPFEGKTGNWFKAIISKTLLIFYLPVLIVVVFALLSFPNISIKL
ncbi:hypothetical protein ACK1LH_03260 [Metabacillus indicus]|uniref:hypothetical protein n=1 Tax=Metabacillus indicus TaxID=246786 RepID=UPI003984132D